MAHSPVPSSTPPEDEDVVKISTTLIQLDAIVKKSGGYQFRVALRDSASMLVGSASQFIVIPNPSKKRLSLSSIVLNRYSAEQWKLVRAGEDSGGKDPEDQKLDNALRVFSKNDVLQFGYLIYDSKPNSQLEIRTRVVKDGQVVMEGEPANIESGLASSTETESAGAITLADPLVAGDYVLQVIVTDPKAKKKYSVATQWVEFEIID